MSKRFLKTSLFFFILLLLNTSAGAHEVRPALIEVTEIQEGVYDILFKIPAKGKEVVKLNPLFPEDFKPLGLVVSKFVPGAFVQRFTLKSNTGERLFGKEIKFEGLRSLRIDVLVQIHFNDGEYISALVQPKAPVFRVPTRGSTAQVAESYFSMGIIHILSGTDHLLFVLALLLIVGDVKKLLWTITAFTLAHSVTLALAALGLVKMSSAPTEAIIALSIVFLCVEIIHSKQGKSSITEKYPWMVALVFGLFHGLGFAGALTEVGLPQHEIPIALLMFNVGVEFGQIIFILAVILIIYLLKKIPLKWPEWSWKILPYAIGSIAAFWVVQRILVFW